MIVYVSQHTETEGYSNMCCISIFVGFFCFVEQDTHRYLLPDQTNHPGTSKHSLSVTQEQS